MSNLLESDRLPITVQRAGSLASEGPAGAALLHSIGWRLSVDGIVIAGIGLAFQADEQQLAADGVIWGVPPSPLTGGPQASSLQLRRG